MANKAKHIQIQDNALIRIFADAKEITLESFKKSVDSADVNAIAESLGYYVGKGKKPGTKLFDDASARFLAARMDGSNVWLMEVAGKVFLFTKTAQAKAA